MTSPKGDLAQARRVSMLNALVTGLGGLFLIVSLVLSIVTVSKAESKVADLEVQAKALAESIAVRESTLANMSPVAAKALGYRNWSSVAQAGTLRSSLSAQKALEGMATRGRASRHNVTVHFFGDDLAKAVNVNVVEPSLRELGFNVVRRPRGEGMADVPVNCLWYGGSVSRADVQAVALLLTSAGVQLRAIKPFENPTGPKASNIEIGGSRAESNAPVWTVDRILEWSH